MTPARQDHDLDCGDASCCACHPPRERCVTCGALHGDVGVPFCSLECATAEGGGAGATCDSESQPGHGD